MEQEKLKTGNILSMIIGFLIATASIGGLFRDGLYRNNLWATSQFQGSDLVRLVVVVPLLFLTLHYTRRGSIRALLLWIGIIWLTLYDYAFYLFGAAFNEFFLIYVALFSFSILTLVFVLPHIDAREIGKRFSPKTPTRWIGVYLVVIAIFLGGLWISQVLRFNFTGELPPSLIASGHITEIIFALDLSLLVPGLVIAALWLWQREPWGYILGAMMLVKGTLYPLALLGMGFFSTRAGVPDAGELTPFWAVFFLVSLFASLVFFGNVKSTD